MANSLNSSMGVAFNDTQYALQQSLRQLNVANLAVQKAALTTSSVLPSMRTLTEMDIAINRSTVSEFKGFRVLNFFRESPMNIPIDTYDMRISCQNYSSISLPISKNIRIGSYNIGVPFQDYNSTSSFVADEIERPIAAKLSKELDVICLQGVKKINRAFITTLRNAGFEIHKPDSAPGEGFDNAIAVRTALFATVRNTSRLVVPQRNDQPYGEDVAGVLLTLKDTNRTVAITSLHTPGSAQYPSGFKGERYDEARSKALADRYALSAFEALDSLGADISVMAGDMSNTQQNQASQFTRIQKRHYTVLQPQNAKDYNGANAQRILGCIFVKHRSFLQKIGNFFKSIFFSSYEVSATPAKAMPGYAFGASKTSSTHLPVATVLSIDETRPLLKIIWSSIKGIFSRAQSPSTISSKTA